MKNNMTETYISWGELAELTHKSQVELFGFCTCEDNDQEENPYADCPTVIDIEKKF